MIQDNIKQILDQIAGACYKIDRDPKEITCIAVTKLADIPQIKEAVGAGLTHIGENKVQEAQAKFPAIESSGIKVTRHMIGHLQTNKVKQAVENFDCIQSVDGLDLALAIEEEAEKLNKDIDILIQVNISGEEQKFGIAPSELNELIERIIDLKYVHLQGLMTIAPLVEDKDIVRGCFRNLRILRDAINHKYHGDRRVDMKYLSMGMTADYEIALEEGSDMVRIGRAIFCDPEE